MDDKPTVDPTGRPHIWVWRPEQETVACGVCGMSRRDLPGSDYLCHGPGSKRVPRS